MFGGEVGGEFEYKVDLAPAGSVGCNRKECQRHRKSIPEGCPRWMSKVGEHENFMCLRPKCLNQVSVKNAIGTDVARTATHGEDTLFSQGGHEV